MTIHTTHPFEPDDGDRDDVRRLRGRLGAAVSLWTSGGAEARAGLTVTSLMVAHGEPGRVLALLDPDSDLADVLQRTGRAVVHLLSWPQRDLADAFAGVTPAPGGPWRLADWVETDHGPRLATASTWAEVDLEDARDAGWSSLVTCVMADVEVGPDTDQLVHRRGRYHRAPSH